MKLSKQSLKVTIHKQTQDLLSFVKLKLKAETPSSWGFQIFCKKTGNF